MFDVLWPGRRGFEGLRPTSRLPFGSDLQKLDRSKLMECAAAPTSVLWRLEDLHQSWKGLYLGSWKGSEYWNEGLVER